MSWLTGWNRRKLITVHGSTSGALSDYQMKLTVHQAGGADSQPIGPYPDTVTKIFTVEGLTIIGSPHTICPYTT